MTAFWEFSILFHQIYGDKRRLRSLVRLPLELAPFNFYLVQSRPLSLEVGTRFGVFWYWINGGWVLGSQREYDCGSLRREAGGNWAVLKTLKVEYRRSGPIPSASFRSSESWQAATNRNSSCPSCWRGTRDPNTDVGDRTDVLEWLPEVYDEEGGELKGKRAWALAGFWVGQLAFCIVCISDEHHLSGLVS